LPPNQPAWPLTRSATAAPPGNVALDLPVGLADLVPGERALQAVDLEEGLPFGRDRIGVTLVPAVTAAIGSVARGATVALATAHAAADVEVFLAGVKLPATDVSFVSAMQVNVTIPNSAPTGAQALLLRAGKVAGPDAPVTVT
jgi:hypothetical protein